MKLRSLLFAGAAVAALTAPGAATAATTGDTVTATVVSGEVTLTPTVSTPMVLGRGATGTADGITSLVATSTNASFGVTAATTTDATYGDGKMHQCTGTTFDASGKTLSQGIEYALGNAADATLLNAATSAFGTASKTIITGGVGAATKFIRWHQPLTAADTILTGESYCFKVTYTIT
jgi:hypothetical protein